MTVSARECVYVREGEAGECPSESVLLKMCVNVAKAQYVHAIIA